MKKRIIKMFLNRAWKPKSIAIPVLRGRATAVREVIDALLKRLDDGILDETEQAAIVGEIIDALF